MSYQTRLQPNITLTSPSGAEFTAKYIGNTRTVEKELGIFKTPGVAGLIVQDLDVSAGLQSITIYFDGPDNDKTSTEFTEAIAERGPWVVVHPVKGVKLLQPSTISEEIQPVESGNVTAITVEWIEVTDAKSVATASQLQAQTLAQNTLLEGVAVDQLDSTVLLDTADKVGKFKTAVKDTVAAYDKNMSKITDTVASVQSQVNSIKRGIDAGLDTVSDVIGLGTQVWALIQSPALILGNLEGKIDAYVNFINDILGNSPTSANDGDINTSAVNDISLTAALGAIGISSVVAEIESRSASIETIESNLNLFNDITSGLDATQTLYEDKLLSRSYFSQSQSYGDAAQMTALTVAYLIKSTFDLSVEKRVIITRPECPVYTAMREYQDLDKIDLFYESNELTGSETLLLPVGKEVVVYL